MKTRLLLFSLAALTAHAADTQTIDLGNGTTRLGDVNSIATLTTNADGVTVLAGRVVRTTGDQVFNDAVMNSG